MPPIPFPASSNPGVRPSEGGGRIINGYAAKQPEGSRFPVIWYRAAGLRELIDVLSHTHTRGLHLSNSTLLHALDTRVYAITKSGTVYSSANLGALSGTLPVTIAQNNAATPDIVAVTENGAFNLFVGSAPTVFADADLPQPNSVVAYNGYFIFTIGDGRIFASALNSVSVAANSTATEQGLALRRAVVYGGQLFALGDKWTAVYRDVGASPFPLERTTVTIARGIVGTFAIAGFEPGWANQLIWAADDYQVVRLDGYTPVPISNDDVSRDIEAAVEAGDGSLLEASVYMNGIHAMWALTYPGHWTWEHNLTTSEWNERESFNIDGWRARRSVKAFDRWIVGDAATGKLAEIDSSYHLEFGDPLVWELTGGNPKTFPSRGAVPRVDFDFTAGTGIASGLDPIQTDPKVLISFSNDGGASWGNPLPRRLGAQGATDQRVSVLRVGKFGSKGKRTRLQVSDPVHVGFQGGQMAIEQRAE